MSGDKRRYFIYSTVVIAVLSVFLYLVGFFVTLDLKVTDFFSVQSADRQQAGKNSVAFAVISDSSLRIVEKIYGMGWPWRRALFGKLCELTKLCGAKTTVFDMLFTEKSIYRVSEKKPYRDVDDDKQFAAQVAANGKVIMAYQNATRKIASQRKKVSLLSKKYSLTVDDMDNSVLIKSYPDALTPVMPLLKNSVSLGCVQGGLDVDGLVRRTRLLFKVGDNYYPSLSLAAYLFDKKIKKAILVKNRLKVGKLQIPLDNEGFLRLKFYGDNNVYYDFNVIYFFIALQKIKQHHALYRKIVNKKSAYTMRDICRSKKVYMKMLDIINKAYLKKFKKRYRQIMGEKLSIIIDGKKYAEAALLKNYRLFGNYIASLSSQQLSPLIRRYAMHSGKAITTSAIKANRKLRELVLRKNGLSFYPKTLPILGLKKWKIGKRVVKRELLYPWQITGKHIFVGSIYSGSRDDKWPTPFSQYEAGMHMHATALDNMLQNDFYNIVSSDLIYLFLIILSSVVASYFCFRFSVAVASVFTGLMLVSILTVSWLLLVYANLIFYPLSSFVTVLFAYGAAIIVNVNLERRQKRYLKNAFSQYLSPKVIDIIMKDPSKLELGGQKRQMTAFFSDLQGSSSIAEKLSPEAVVALFNDYLTRMCNIISKYDGTIDKFEGDAIVAFWGAPLSQEEHALLTCRAAIEMQKSMVLLRAEYAKQDKPALHMRIGINSGEMVVGNMGSKQRMDYTIMGDSVNLAARLEGANKFYGTYTMVSENTYSLVKEQLVARELDKINVFGKELPVTVYELLDERGRLDRDTEAQLALYQDALQLYKEKEFEKAIAVFRQVLEQGPDAPSETYIKRCEQYIATPPPADWDGVYRLTSKG